MPKKSSTVPVDILSLLSPERRAELMAEILGAEVRALLERHMASTFGGLVDGLRAHPAWNHLRDFPLSAVFQVGPTAAAPPSPAPPAAPAKPPVAAKPRRRALKKAKAARGAGPARRRSPRKGDQPSPVSDAYLDEILAFVKANGGLRKEEIQKRTGGEGRQVGAALAALKDQKRVTTTGKARGTTYSAQ